MRQRRKVRLTQVLHLRPLIMDARVKPAHDAEFICRHLGARAWIAAHGIFPDGNMGSGQYEQATLSIG
jgi:hypothetical protein